MNNMNINGDIFNRARKLIQMDATGEMSKKTKNTISENRKQASVGDDDEFIINTPPPKKRITENDDLNNYHINDNIISNCKGLPLEILESFRDKKIDTNNLNNGVNGTGSILDDLERLTGKPLVEQRVVNEEVVHKQTIPQVSNSIQTNVDYSMIKMIVEDCMKKSLLSIKKTLNENKTNENNNNIQALKIGDKFSFITENGDLYEAKLEFKKNLKKK